MRATGCHDRSHLPHLQRRVYSLFVSLRQRLISPGWPQILYIVKDALEVLILLPPALSTGIEAGTTTVLDRELAQGCRNTKQGLHPLSHALML